MNGAIARNQIGVQDSKERSRCAGLVGSPVNRQMSGSVAPWRTNSVWPSRRQVGSAGAASVSPTTTGAPKPPSPIAACGGRYGFPPPTSARLRRSARGERGAQARREDHERGQPDDVAVEQRAPIDDADDDP